MARRRSTKRPWGAEHPELDVERARGGTRVEHGPDGTWTVRSVSAAAALKPYTCPGCGGTVPPGEAHVVAWQEDHLLGREAGLADRRHWHSACWRTRGTRGPRW